MDQWKCNQWKLPDKFLMGFIPYEIWSPYSGVDEDSSFSGCDALLIAEYLPELWISTVLPSPASSSLGRRQHPKRLGSSNSPYLTRAKVRKTSRIAAQNCTVYEGTEVRSNGCLSGKISRVWGCSFYCW